MDGNRLLESFQKLRKSSIQIPLLGIFFSLLVILFFALSDYLIFGMQAERISLKNAISKSSERNSFLQSEVQKASDALVEIRLSPFFSEFLSKGDETDLKTLLSYITNTDRNIMQLRFIDEKGIEKIRFDKSDVGEKARQVVQEQLQDKSNRYYFQESISKDEEVWFSKLDLNIEHGKVETPFKPTYRAILPIREEGIFRGILIANYFAEPMLDSLLANPLYETILTDSQGCVLVHSNSAKNWGCQKEVVEKIDSEYTMALGKELYESEKFVSRKMILPFQNELYLILQLNKKYQEEQNSNYLLRLALTSTVVLVISLLVSIFLAKISSLVDEKIAQLDKKRKENAKDKFKQMSDMLVRISHHWRQPLNIIALSAQNIHDLYIFKHLNEENLNEKVETIITHTIKMSKTLDEYREHLVDYGEQEMFTIKDIINTLKYSTEPELKNRSITLEYTIHNEILPICGNMKSLQNILHYIIENAANKITEESVQDGKINIEVRQKESNVELSIEDNGGGIDVEIMDKIFDPFYTTKELTQAVGSGLYFAKISLENHFNGTIEAKNGKNGAIFLLTIPLCLKK